VMGALSVAVRSKQRGKGSESGGPAQRAEEEEGWGSSNARTGWAADAWSCEGGGLDDPSMVMSGGGGRRSGKQGTWRWEGSSRWAVARPPIQADQMNSSFLDLIQIISTKPDLFNQKMDFLNSKNSNKIWY
jgi:hypothetical protein